MTSQPSDTPPTGPEDMTVRQLTDPLRQPAAFLLLLANGLILLFAVMDLFVITEDWATNFAARAGASSVDFVGVVSIGFPLLAVLLSTHVRSRVPQARLITALALVEYVVSALFGALCVLVDFLHGMTDSQTTLGIGSARRAAEDFLVRTGEFAVLAIAAFAVFQIFQGLYASARTPQQPSGGYPYGYPPTYGQPAPGPQPAPPPEGETGEPWRRP